MYGSHHRGGLMGLTNRIGSCHDIENKEQSGESSMVVGSKGVPHGKSTRTTPTTRPRPIPGRRPSRGHLPGIGLFEKWLYKWRDRYLATDPSWSAERSRRPRTPPTQTPQRIAQVVVALR